ncbi:unnamed protein product [Chondrus crispus]|uniref:Uncharacterized protein n=1 Tax=Chondrus crispus TaxID=2769 RepID=R7QQ39_CHOCR|nr:unnamed protein product [Chondrus crispus]CDF40239.1 unnamed protein product [Chondrus crispus]|eukprot:XP_005710533.1 unnamed protein product [Chondrus crispus]
MNRTTFHKGTPMANSALIGILLCAQRNFLKPVRIAWHDGSELGMEKASAAFSAASPETFISLGERFRKRSGVDALRIVVLGLTSTLKQQSLRPCAMC